MRQLSNTNGYAIGREEWEMEVAVTVKGGKKIFKDVGGALRTRSLGVAPGGLRKKEGERVVVTARVSRRTKERT